MKETDVQNTIRLRLSKGNTRLFRNNVGMLEDRKGNFVRYGLCPGSSDLIGWTTVTVTPDMVGKQVAVFTAVEVKASRTRATEQQYAFICAVKKAGGRAGVARGIMEAKQIIEGKE